MKRSIQLVIIGAAISLVCLVLLFIKKPAAIVTESPQVIRLQAWFDWNLYSGPGALTIKRYTSEKLVEKNPEGFYVSRIAREIRIQENSAEIDLRESVYWSDGTLMKAEQIIDAVARRLQSIDSNTMDPEPRVTSLLQRYKITQSGPFSLKIDNVASSDDLYSVLDSYGMSPIRKDLLARDGDQTGWRVTIGPYVPVDTQKTEFYETDLIHFTPNPFYYRGTPPVGVSLKPAELVPAKTDR